jgi:hypothetical protein
MAHPHDPVSRGVRAVIRALKKPDANRYEMLLEACVSLRPDYMAMVWHICADPRTQVENPFDSCWLFRVCRAARLGRANVLRLLHKRFNLPAQCLTNALTDAARLGYVEVLRAFWQDPVICWNSIMCTVANDYVTPYSPYYISRNLFAIRSINELIDKVSPRCCTQCREWNYLVQLVCDHDLWQLPHIIKNRTVQPILVSAADKLRQLLACPPAQAKKTVRTLGILTAILLTQTGVGHNWRQSPFMRLGVAWLSTVQYLLCCADNPSLPQLPDEIWEQIAAAVYNLHMYS